MSNVWIFVFKDQNNKSAQSFSACSGMDTIHFTPNPSFCVCNDVINGFHALLRAMTLSVFSQNASTTGMIALTDSFGVGLPILLCYTNNKVSHLSTAFQWRVYSVCTLENTRGTRGIRPVTEHRHLLSLILKMPRVLIATTAILHERKKDSNDQSQVSNDRLALRASFMASLLLLMRLPFLRVPLGRSDIARYLLQILAEFRAHAQLASADLRRRDVCDIFITIMISTPRLSSGIHLDHGTRVCRSLSEINCDSRSLAGIISSSN